MPIFPVADHLCYLRLTGIHQSAEGVAARARASARGDAVARLCLAHRL
jgi:hypothetical protein